MVMAMPTWDFAVWLRGAQPAQALHQAKSGGPYIFDAHPQGGEPTGQCRRLHDEPVAPFPGSNGSPPPGDSWLATLGPPPPGVNTRLWTTLWIIWGERGESLWTPGGDRCEFPAFRAGGW